MKTIEEKAKAYDKAVEQAEKEILACGSLNCDAARLIFRLFPDFKESEDEKMVRFIANELTCLRASEGKDSCRYNELTSALSWLEKQKEQKPADYCSVRDEFDLDGNLKQKSAWNEEDTLMLTATIQTLERFGGRGTTGMQIDWLKTLPERFNLQSKQE